MNIIINTKSEKAIYEQIYDQIVSEILAGELPADFQLPSIRSIALELNISVITIKKAWEMLEANGFIYTKSAVGCFVKAHNNQGLIDKKYDLAKEKLQKDLDYFQSLGLTKKELQSLIDELF